MRVVCIDDSYNKLNNRDGIPNIKKGRIYNVIELYYCVLRKQNYYILVECGMDNGYHPSQFVEIEDDQIDETEIYQQRKQQTV